MMPLLLFVYSDKQPSVNPAVFDYLYNVAAINQAAAEAKAAKEAAAEEPFGYIPRSTRLTQPRLTPTQYRLRMYVRTYIHVY